MRPVKCDDGPLEKWLHDGAGRGDAVLELFQRDILSARVFLASRRMSTDRRFPFHAGQPISGKIGGKRFHDREGVGLRLCKHY